MSPSLCRQLALDRGLRFYGLQVTGGGVGLVEAVCSAGVLDAVC